MAKGLLQSSKQKQKLYERFSKKEVHEKKTFINQFKSLFESLNLSKLASVIPESQTQFHQHQNRHRNFMGEGNLTGDELKEAWPSLKPNTISGYDRISSNMANETSDINVFVTSLEYIFSVSLQQRIFPENLKIAKVSHR